MYILFDDFHFCGYTDHPMTPDWPFLPNLENVRFSTSHLQSLEASRSLFYEQMKYSIMTLEELSPLGDTKVMTLCQRHNRAFYSLIMEYYSSHGNYRISK